MRIVSILLNFYYQFDQKIIDFLTSIPQLIWNFASEFLTTLPRKIIEVNRQKITEY